MFAFDVVNGAVVVEMVDLVCGCRFGGVPWCCFALKIDNVFILFLITANFLSPFKPNLTKFDEFADSSNFDK